MTFFLKNNLQNTWILNNLGNEIRTNKNGTNMYFNDIENIPNYSISMDTKHTYSFLINLSNSFKCGIYFFKEDKIHRISEDLPKNGFSKGIIQIFDFQNLFDKNLFFIIFNLKHEITCKIPILLL